MDGSVALVRIMRRLDWQLAARTRRVLHRRNERRRVRPARAWSRIAGIHRLELESDTGVTIACFSFCAGFRVGPWRRFWRCRWLARSSRKFRRPAPAAVITRRGVATALFASTGANWNLGCVTSSSAANRISLPNCLHCRTCFHPCPCPRCRCLRSRLPSARCSPLAIRLLLKCVRPLRSPDQASGRAR